MTSPLDEEAIVAMVLGGTPPRVADAVLPPTPEAKALYDASSEALAQLAATLPQPKPSPALRDRIEAALTARNRDERRVVLVMDMIEDYLTPGRPLHVPRARSIIPALQARIERARREGTPVFYLCDYHEPGDPDYEVWPQHALAGTTGHQVIAELAPLPDEPVIKHRTYSGFWETNLEQQLRGREANLLEIVGCATEVGMMATATDALMRGFRVEIPADTQAGTSETAENVAMAVLKVLRPLEPMRASAR